MRYADSANAVMESVGFVLKHLEAALAGWRVLRLTERQLEIGVIERIVDMIANRMNHHC